MILVIHFSNLKAFEESISAPSTGFLSFYSSNYSPGLTGFFPSFLSKDITFARKYCFTFKLASISRHPSSESLASNCP